MGQMTIKQIYLLLVISQTNHGINFGLFNALLTYVVVSFWRVKYPIILAKYNLRFS